jgi:integrase
MVCGERMTAAPRHQPTNAELRALELARIAKEKGLDPRRITVAGTHGRRVSYRAASDAVMKVRKKIGAEAYDIHALRHTAAHELAEAGCTDAEIMAITGHKSEASVRRYSAASAQRRRALEAQKKRT